MTDEIYISHPIDFDFKNMQLETDLNLNGLTDY